MLKNVAFKRVSKHISLLSVKLLNICHFVLDQLFEVMFVTLKCEDLFNGVKGPLQNVKTYMYV